MALDMEKSTRMIGQQGHEHEPVQLFRGVKHNGCILSTGFSAATQPLFQDALLLDQLLYL